VSSTSKEPFHTGYGTLVPEGDHLRYAQATLWPLLGVLLIVLGAAALAVDRWGDSAFLQQRLGGLLPFLRPAAWFVLALGITSALYIRRLVLIHRDGTVTFVRDFVFARIRQHYSNDDAFGLAILEEEFPSEQGEYGIYALELVLMNGKRIRLLSFPSLSELHDCRRYIEKFTGQEIARKKISDPLRWS
jgi:hypothetical protein